MQNNSISRLFFRGAGGRQGQGISSPGVPEEESKGKGFMNSDCHGEGLIASDWTSPKQNAFAEFLRAYAAIAEQIQKKWSLSERWTYLELTAGPGIINAHGYEIHGSPLIALNTFRNTKSFRVDCHFIEHDPGRFEALNQSVKAEISEWSADDQRRVQVNLECCDNKSVLKNGLPCGSYGLIYWDGLGQDTFPSIELREWLTSHSRHDLLLMASGTAPKRKGKGFPRVDRMLYTVPRKIWLSDTNGRWQWIFALATDWAPLAEKLSGYSSIKLYHSASVKGLQILDQLGSTYIERQKRDQPGLWPDESI